MPRKTAKTALKSIPSIPDSLKQGERGGANPEIPAASHVPGAVFGTGLQAISQEIALYAREAFANTGQTVRGLLTAKTYEDVVRLQTELAQRNLAGWAVHAAKLTALGCELVNANLGNLGNTGVESWNKRNAR